MSLSFSSVLAGVTAGLFFFFLSELNLELLAIKNLFHKTQDDPEML